jgi:hypothetical protein
MKTFTAILLCLTLAFGPIACTSNDVQDSISAAAQIADTWSAFMMSINPTVGGDFAVAAQALRDAGKGYSDYLAAEETLKGQKAAELRAALIATQQNLALILNDARIRNQDKLEYITAAVAVVNSTIILILSRLPSPPGTVTQAAVIGMGGYLPKLPSNVRNAKQMKQYWNSRPGLPQTAQVK